MIYIIKNKYNYKKGQITIEMMKNLLNTPKYQIFNRFYYNFSTVRVRYAPSPTGMMHIGGLRTALFNYLYAKKNSGQFIVRIQDTDQARNVPGSIQNIFQTLKWLQINPDESIHNCNQKYQPYIQSQRLHLYKQIQKALLKNNLAYPCFCNHEKRTQSNSTIKNKIKNKNHEQEQQTISQQHYDGTCKKLTFQQVKQRILKGQKYAVRIKSNIFNLPQYFKDQNYGSVPFVKFDDFIIIKSDGWPTFHFANVIDDWKMEVSHVIRGQQWLTNTSKHIYLYKLLNAPVPKFFHLPLIQNQNGKKLAKRDPTSSLAILKNQYQPEAIKNFIFRLGWNPKQNVNQKQQIQLLNDEQMINIFDQQGITKNPAKFDIKILNHLNRKCFKNKWKQFQILRKKQSLTKTQKYKLNQLKSSFIKKLNTQLQDTKFISEDKLILMWQIVHDRINVNSDIKQFTYFGDENKKLSYQSQKALKDLKTIFGPNTQLKQNLLLYSSSQNLTKNLKIIHNLRLIFQHLLSQNEFQQEKIAQKISQFLYQNIQFKNQQVYGILRLILTQQKSGPSILKVMIILGRPRCLKLINSFHQMLVKSHQNKIQSVIF